MRRSEIVIEGAGHFRTAEVAVGTALEELMSCGAHLLRLRREAGMSQIFGQSAVESLLSTIEMVGGGMVELGTLHKELDQVKTDMGCRTVMVGGESGKPPIPQTGMAPLEVVASKTAA